MRRAVLLRIRDLGECAIEKVWWSWVLIVGDFFGKVGPCRGVEARHRLYWTAYRHAPTPSPRLHRLPSCFTAILWRDNRCRTAQDDVITERRGSFPPGAGVRRLHSRFGHLH
ncbi:hypothetical protein IG631_03933 [Alternaria alternata]|nr:hypothetical protein IG631_03933 [Alternaria alternata]